MVNKPLHPASRARTAGTESVSSVRRAVAILDMLAQGDSLRVIDVSRRLGVANSTAHRLLSALRDSGYLRQEVGSSRYIAGHALLNLSRRINIDHTLSRMALPFVQKLRDELNETIHLEVLIGNEVLFLVSAEDDHRLRVASRVGGRSPAYASAGGKVLLSELPVAELKSRFANGLAELTPQTKRDIFALLTELEEVRKTGYAMNLDETDVGVHAVAVPVRGTDGRIAAALSMAAPTVRLPPVRLATVLPWLKDTSEVITRQCYGPLTQDLSRSAGTGGAGSVRSAV